MSEKLFMLVASKDADEDEHSSGCVSMYCADGKGWNSLDKIIESATHTTVNRPALKPALLTSITACVLCDSALASSLNKGWDIQMVEVGK